MKSKNINQNIAEVTVRLLTLEWFLDTFKKQKNDEMFKFFNKEIKQCLKSMEKYYLGFSTDDKKAPKKKKKPYRVKYGLSGEDLLIRPRKINRSLLAKPFPMPLNTEKTTKVNKNARKHSQKKTKTNTQKQKSKVKNKKSTRRV